MLSVIFISRHLQNKVHLTSFKIYNCIAYCRDKITVIMIQTTATTGYALLALFLCDIRTNKVAIAI